MWGEKIELSVQEDDNPWLENRLKFSDKDKANTSKSNKKTGELEFRKNILIDQVEVYLKNEAVSGPQMYVIFGEHDEKAHYDLLGYTFLGELRRWIHSLKLIIEFQSSGIELELENKSAQEMKASTQEK